jgi:hypothetical protein
MTDPDFRIRSSDIVRDDASVALGRILFEAHETNAMLLRKRQKRFQRLGLAVENLPELIFELPEIPTAL